MMSSTSSDDLPVLSVAKDPRDELQEVLDYLKFSYRPDATYKGTCVFDITPSETNPHMVFYIRCDPNAPTEAGMGLPSDGKYSCYTTMSRDDFFLLYSGKASPAQVASMCLSGRMKVKWWRYHELQQFASAFTYSTPNWIMFYRLKGKDALMQDLINLQWKHAIPQNCLVNSNGFIVKPESLDPNERTELEKVRDNYLHPQPIVASEPSVMSTVPTVSSIGTENEIEKGEENESSSIAQSLPAPVPIDDNVETVSSDSSKISLPMSEKIQTAPPNQLPEVSVDLASTETPEILPATETIAALGNQSIVAVPEEQPIEQAPKEEVSPSLSNPSSVSLPETSSTTNISPESASTPLITKNTLTKPESILDITISTAEPSVEGASPKIPTPNTIILSDSSETIPSILPSESGNTSNESIPSSLIQSPESTVSARLLVPDITSESVVEAAAVASFSSSDNNSTNNFPSSTESLSVSNAVISIDPNDLSSIQSSVSSEPNNNRSFTNRSNEAVDTGKDIQILLRLSELLQQTNISSSILHDSNISVLEYDPKSAPPSCLITLPVDQSIASLLDTVESNLSASLECEANLKVLTKEYQQQLDNHLKEKNTKSSFFSFNFFTDEATEKIKKRTNDDNSSFASTIINWFSSTGSSTAKESSTTAPTESLEKIILRKQKEQIQHDSTCSSALQHITKEIESFEQSQVSGRYLSLLVPRRKPIAAQIQARYLFPLLFIHANIKDKSVTSNLPKFLDQIPYGCADCFSDGNYKKWSILSSLQSMNQFVTMKDPDGKEEPRFIDTLRIPDQNFRFQNLDSFILHQYFRQSSTVHRSSIGQYQSLLSSSSQIYLRLRKLLDTISNGTADNSSSLIDKSSKSFPESIDRERSSSLLNSLTSSSFSILQSTHAEGMGVSHPTHPYHPPNLPSALPPNSIHDIDDIRANSIHGSTAGSLPHRSINQGRILPDGAELTIETHDHHHHHHHHNVPMDGAVPLPGHVTNNNSLPLFNSSAQYTSLQFKYRFGHYHASIWDSVLDLANYKRTDNDTYHYGLDTFRDGLSKLPLFLPSSFFPTKEDNDQEKNVNTSNIDISTLAYRTLKPWLQQPPSSPDNYSSSTVLSNLQHIETFLFCFGIPFCPLSSRAPVTLGALEVKIDNPLVPIPISTTAYSPMENSTDAVTNTDDNTNLASQLHVALLPIWRPKRLIYHSLSSFRSTEHSSIPSTTTPLPTVYNGLGSHVYLGVAKQRLRLQFQEAMQRIADDLPSFNGTSSSMNSLNGKRKARTEDTTALYGFGDETLQSVGPPLSSLMRKDIPSTVLTDIVRTLRKQGVWKLYGQAKALDAFTADSHTIDIVSSVPKSTESSSSADAST